MARQIIVLDISQANGGQKAVRVAFWFPIAQAKAYPKPTFQSAVDPTLAQAGQPSAQEISDLRAGLVLEEVGVYIFASSYTTAQIKADLQQLYTDRLAAVTAQPNPISFYGVSFDGAVWSA